MNDGVGCRTGEDGEARSCSGSSKSTAGVSEPLIREAHSVEDALNDLIEFCTNKDPHAPLGFKVCGDTAKVE